MTQPLACRVETGPWHDEMVRSGLAGNLPKPSGARADHPFAVSQTWSYDDEFATARPKARMAYWLREETGIFSYLLRDVAHPGRAPVAAAWVLDNILGIKHLTAQVIAMGKAGLVSRNFEILHGACGAIILREGLGLDEMRDAASRGRLDDIVRVLVDTGSSHHAQLAFRAECAALLALVGECLGDRAALTLGQ